MNKVNVEILPAKQHHNKYYLQKLNDANREFAWNKKQIEKINKAKAKYPQNQKQSALIEVLHMAQDDFEGWLPLNLQKLVANTLDIPMIKVEEVVSFYSMFNTIPVGKYHIKVCTHCACSLNGALAVLNSMKEEIGKLVDNISEDGLFSIEGTECLGACGNGPVMTINGQLYENIDVERAKELIKEIRGKEIDD